MHQEPSVVLDGCSTGHRRSFANSKLIIFKVCLYNLFMLPKPHPQTQLPYNCSQSFSHMNSRRPNSNRPELWLKKSIFHASREMEESYVFRGKIEAEGIPLMEVIHLSQHWMLVQTPKLSCNFFCRLNAGHYDNAYQELLKIFANFTNLARYYGFFRPTANMIFTKGYSVKVWMHEDIFSNSPMMQLGEGVQAEKDFVAAFLAMVEAQMPNWQKVPLKLTLSQTDCLLEQRAQIYRGMHKENGHWKPQESRISIQTYSLDDNNKKMNFCPSMEEHLRLSQTCELPRTNTRGARHNTMPNQQVPQRVFQQISNRCVIRQDKRTAPKVTEFTGDIRKTKASFNLSSTSSTLGQFSEKWRTTVGKKTKMDSPSNEVSVSSSVQIVESVMSIQSELEGLFSDNEDRQLLFGAEGNRQELERIAQEMEEVLIW